MRQNQACQGDLRKPDAALRLITGLYGRSNNAFDIGFAVFLFLFQESIVAVAVWNIGGVVAQIRYRLYLVDISVILAAGLSRLHLVETDKFRLIGSRLWRRFDDLFLDLYLHLFLNRGRRRRRLSRFFAGERFATGDTRLRFTTEIVKLGSAAFAMSLLAT